ncbi:MAG: FGGY-family carbohydrate kinase [Armatimonadetes bacterium]|nr:FGGY-family carbohydrate kinase [Armatimonadota bacterium]
MAHYVIGVDVGTGSARAGVFDLAGNLLGASAREIQIFQPREDYVEQSSEDIWRAAGEAVREAVERSEAAPEDVIGISFDATCSLVALDRENRPLTVALEGDPSRNIIVWMDHRAIEEAEEINRQGHEVLKYVGGRISPEMEAPKLRWLKKSLPDTWRQAGKFFDLADYLVYQATGNDIRSLCTVVCKWTYQGHIGSFGAWDKSFFEKFGLEDLFDGGKVTGHVRPMGTPAGTLTPEAARRFGLTEKCAVGVGIIDAHAGGLGSLGAVWSGEEGAPLERLDTALALIGGTSSCHMAVSMEPKYIPGVWGPYYGAMVPGMWLTEGGQSATGALIDCTIANHAQAEPLRKRAQAEGKTVYEILNETVARLQKEAGVGPELTEDIFILPYHHGNRSPNADPMAKGVVDGVTLDMSPESLARLYYATIQAIAYGTRDIVEAMNRAGYRIDRIYATGGGTKNPLWLQEHADITGCALVLPREPEAVLLGTAILAAVAAVAHPDIPSAMKAMDHPGESIRPNPSTHKYHQAKYAVFKEMYRQHLARRKRMEEI